jgi:hypothetical protein
MLYRSPLVVLFVILVVVAGANSIGRPVGSLMFTLPNCEMRPA